MAFWIENKALMCKLFLAILGDRTSKRFQDLPVNSISSWKDLAKDFVARYITNSKEPVTLDSLFHSSSG